MLLHHPLFDHMLITPRQWIYNRTCESLSCILFIGTARGQNGHFVRKFKCFRARLSFNSLYCMLYSLTGIILYVASVQGPLLAPKFVVRTFWHTELLINIHVAENKAILTILYYMSNFKYVSTPVNVIER